MVSLQRHCEEVEDIFSCPISWLQIWAGSQYTFDDWVDGVIESLENWWLIRKRKCTSKFMLQFVSFDINFKGMHQMETGI